MPYQTVVVTPTVLDRRRTSSETAVSGDTDDGVARVEVDIDGELTGSFAVGDEGEGERERERAMSQPAVRSTHI